VLQESESSNDEREREGAGEDEDEDEEDAGDAAGDEEDELDETTLELLNGKVEMRRHKAQLEGLKKKDPDFFEYLQSASLSPGASQRLYRNRHGVSMGSCFTHAGNALCRFRLTAL
jgi:hypothetical protein